MNGLQEEGTGGLRVLLKCYLHLPQPPLISQWRWAPARLERSVVPYLGGGSGLRGVEENGVNLVIAGDKRKDNGEQCKCQAGEVGCPAKRRQGGLAVVAQSQPDVGPQTELVG